ncbi:hypothetical protein BJ742DRAFT_818274 [Cladochytrium replicatum]|nr:hypothetical protein BJ742DRAFT_818274 [Cladochytrium replicatum]
MTSFGRNSVIGRFESLSNFATLSSLPRIRGSWDVGSIEHEAILATGIYYCDIDNVTTSTLSFRMAVDATSIDPNDDVQQTYRINK